jgi:glutamate synthase (NADPH) small chain
VRVTICRLLEHRLKMNTKELSDLQNRCIQEEIPPCQVDCPLHIDVRVLIKHVQSGDFKSAWKGYHKQVKFPGIVSRTCPQPCRHRCKRKEVDESISIRLLEQACDDYGYFEIRSRFATFKKNKQVAVIGGGLAGLTCAMQLAAKGYSVALYDQAEKLGGSLWKMKRDILTGEIIERDLSAVYSHAIDIHPGAKIEKIAELTFDALLIATGSMGTIDESLKGPDGHLQINPVSLETSRSGIFAAGSVNPSPKGHSTVDSIAQGIRAAISIERYFKNASLTLGRENEQNKETRIYTSLSGVVPSNAVKPDDNRNAYTGAQAQQESNRCLLCQCLECTKKCVYLKHYGGYPKTYINEMGTSIDALDGITARTANRLINSCSLCGLCEEVCPTRLNSGQAALAGRQLMFDQGVMPPAFHDFWLRDMAFSNGKCFHLAKNQPGTEKSRYLFYPGCQLSASRPSYIEKAYLYLVNNLEGGVGLALGCCGAPAHWAGRRKLHREQVEIFHTDWETLGRPDIITACPTCTKMIKTYDDSFEVQQLWTVLEKSGPPRCSSQPGNPEVAIYDPCASRYDPTAQQSIRRLLKMLGYDALELPQNGREAACCSYGGLIAFTDPVLAAKITKARISASSRPYVTYCINCREDFAKNGKAIWHVLDLMFSTDVDANKDKPPMTYSEKRKNRTALKQQLLHNFWGEPMKPDPAPYAHIHVIMDEDVKNKINNELILEEEIQEVIHGAESSGEKIIDTASGRLMAHKQVGIITIWVEYQPEDSGFRVFNAYSHRMQIVKG